MTAQSAERAPVVIPEWADTNRPAFEAGYRMGAMRTAMMRLENGDAKGAYDALANAMTFAPSNSADRTLVQQ